MKKRILAGATLILAVGGVIIMASDSYAWVKDDIQGPVLESVAATFYISDSILAQSKSNDNRKKFLDAMEGALKDIETPEVIDRLKDLKRQWELDRKWLDSEVNTKKQMLAEMAKRKTVTMRESGL